MLKYFALGVQYVQDALRVWLEARRINYWLKILIIFLEELHELFPIVAHVHQHRLPDFFDEELKLGIFRGWI